MVRSKKFRNPNQRLNKWAYIFIAPFILTFLLFSLYPIISSIATAFTNDNYQSWALFPDFTAGDNFLYVLQDKYMWHAYLNTLIIFVMNFIPQVLSALFFAVIFTSKRIRIHGKGFFKFVYFLPNILTAATVAALFDAMFKYDGQSASGIFYHLFVKLGMDPSYHFFDHPWATRIIIAFIQFWMWFGNSMIVYIAGIKGISDEVFEAAELDGASPLRVFKDITLPILKPIMLYSMITSIIGGLQMFDIPYMLPSGIFQEGFFQGCNGTETITIYIYRFMKLNEDYGIASAASVIFFGFSLMLSIAMYMLFFKNKNNDKKMLRRMKKYG